MKLLICFIAAFLSSTFALAEITITFGGDLNFSPSRAPVNNVGSKKHGTFYTWEEMFEGLAPLLDGDLNFANMESVISDQNLPDTGGEFTFNSHPDGFAYAVEIGFDLFSLSNNHIGDYGTEGMTETLYWLERINKEVGAIYFSGLAANKRAALKPTIIPVTDGAKKYKIAFLAMTAVANKSSQASEDRPGTLYFKDKKDFTEGLARLRDTKADYKILSIHGGREGYVTLDSGQQERYELAMKNGDVDLILAHHPHRVRPIQLIDQKLIFYSLGNYHMLGAANINSLGSQKDYGLHGKVHLAWDEQKRRLVAQAAQIIPLTDVHSSAKPMTPEESAQRVETLNELSEQELGSSALIFDIQEMGWGEVCLSTTPGPRAQEICN